MDSGKEEESLLAYAQRRGKLKQKSLSLPPSPPPAPPEEEVVEEIKKQETTFSRYSKEARSKALDHHEAQETIRDATETELAKNVGKKVPPEVSAKHEDD